MIELEPWVFETLHIIKQLHEHGCLDRFLDRCGGLDLDGDYYETAWEATSDIFAEFNIYCNQDDETDALVFHDPVITEFFKLCRLYEAKMDVPAEKNAHRDALERGVFYAMQVDGYDYDCRIYDGTHGRPRLVFLNGPEFCGHYELPGALIEAYNAFVYHAEQLRRELESKDSKKKKIVKITKEVRKEAA